MSGTTKLSDLARHVVLPDGLTTTGWPAVREKCRRELGLGFDPWQDGTGRAILGKTADGLYAASVGGAVLSIPRQVGKTYLVGAICFALCLLNPGITVIWTAHRLRTAAETFAAMQAMARRERIAPHVAKVVLGSGEEEIRFHNDSRILFGARERGFGRGFALVDVEVFDEAQILTDNAIDDMVPAMNQAANPLLLFAGTPPKPTDPGEVFAGKRAKALAGMSEGMLYVEFSADPDADPDDRAQWAKANPSYPRRTPASAMMRMRENLTDDSYLREALGIWENEGARRVIQTDDWAAVADEHSMATDRFALAVDVDPDRTYASVALAGQREDGGWHVELDEHRAGVGWIAPYLERLLEANPQIRAVVVDGASSAASIIDDLALRRIKVTTTGVRDMAKACGQLYDGVLEQWLRHTDQPQVNLALSVARKRPLLGGEAWGWNRKDATSDITPLVAITLALWGAQAPTVKRPMRRPAAQRAAKPRRAVVL